MLALLALAGTACSDLEGVLPDGTPVAGDEAPADEGDGAAGVAPITADDVRRVCSDPEASATTAEELAPLVNLTPETFEALACAAVS